MFVRRENERLRMDLNHHSLVLQTKTLTFMLLSLVKRVGFEPTLILKVWQIYNLLPSPP